MLKVRWPLQPRYSADGDEIVNGVRQGYGYYATKEAEDYGEDKAEQSNAYDPRGALVAVVADEEDGAEQDGDGFGFEEFFEAGNEIGAHHQFLNEPADGARECQQCKFSRA